MSEAATDTRTDTRTLRVLVVDDSEDLRMMLRFRLARVEGLEVVGEAADGQAAVEVMRTARPDVVVMDLAMPRMDGLTAAAAIRETHPDVTLVALTGYSRESLEEKSRAAGFDHYIVKGGSLAELEGLLNNLRG